MAIAASAAIAPSAAMRNVLSQDRRCKTDSLGITSRALALPRRTRRCSQCGDLGGSFSMRKHRLSRVLICCGRRHSEDVKENSGIVENDKIAASDIVKAQKGSEEEQQQRKVLGRREALALSVAIPLAELELDRLSSNSSTGSSASSSSASLSSSSATAATARALMQTGMERDEQRAAGSAIDNLKGRISTFALANGMRWIVLERHQAPVVACHTYANVGASSESSGMTGLAHFLEHLAFKGTRRVGTRDPNKEANLLDQLDEVFYDLQDAKREGRNVEPGLFQKFVDLQAAAAELSIPNEYGSLIERQGGVGLNAQTSQDSTEYYVSLPANKLELWMALESGRFIAPVFRELYSEKEVIKEERRLRVDNTPFGRFTEAFSETAFPRQPYGRPVIGYPDDFERLGRREVATFFKENYTPQSLTCAVVGDVDPAEVEKLAEKYFGPWQAPPKSVKQGRSLPAETWRTRDEWDSIVRPAGRRTLRLNLSSQPIYMEGYYRPPASSFDDPAITVLNEVLSGGRSSRFYKRVILPGKALSAQSAESFPGDKLPCLLLLYAIPPPGTSTDLLANILHRELDDLARKNVNEDELVPIKKSARASLLEAFGNNRVMAKLLSSYQAVTGQWENLLEENELVSQVSPIAVQQAAARLFLPSNRVSGHVVTS